MIYKSATTSDGSDKVGIYLYNLYSADDAGISRALPVPVIRMRLVNEEQTTMKWMHSNLYKFSTVPL